MRWQPRGIVCALTIPLALCLSAGNASACSLTPIWGVQSSSLIAFLATPLADTVLAGEGSMRPGAGVGHTGPGRARAIYGQRVRVDQLGEQARRALPADVREAVLVPWDYAADCTPVPWNRSARWLGETRAGVFRAVLRARAEWADGLPTFDIVGTSMQPYTETVNAASNERGRGIRQSARLNAVSLLRLYDRLPPVRATPDSVAALALARELSSDPEFAGKYPATEFVLAARMEIDNARRVGMRIPIAGTFQLEVRVGSARPQRFFLRTADAVTSLHHAPSPGSDSTMSPPRPAGYYFYASIARTMTELARSCFEPGAGVVSYMDLDWHDAAPEDRAGEWMGGLDARLVEHVLTANQRSEWRASFQRAARARSDSVAAFFRSLRERGLSPDSVPLPSSLEFKADRPLRIIRDATGRASFTGSIRRADTPAIQMRGERISREVLPCEIR